MDLQTYVDNAVKAARQETLSNSDQLTVGEILLKLEPIIEKQKHREEEAGVYFDFGYMRPTDIDSWRGIYAELALNYTEDQEAMKVSEFYEMIKGCIGKTFEGYKGGEFTMSKHTPVWVANYGNSGGTAVVEIVDGGYQVLIITGYRES